MIRYSNEGEKISGDGQSTSSKTDTKLYKKRWWMLLLYAIYSATSAFQWINYSIISTIIVKFYGVSSSAADWLSMIFMMSYIPLIFPVTWLLDRYGLRIIAIVGSSLNAVGAIVKVASNKPHLFAVCMTGSTITAIGQVFILGMQSKIAATWFGLNEVSTACALGLFGYQSGIALGFLIPPNVVPDTDDKSVIEHRLNILTISTAVFTTILAALVWLTFEKQPEVAPSQAQAKYLSNNEEDSPQSYLDSMKKLFSDRSSILLIISFGINNGSLSAFLTLLNDIILSRYPTKQTDAGMIGLTIVICGMIGEVICGVILDRTRTYRKTTVATYFLGLLTYAIFAAILDIGHLWLVYVTAATIGFTMTGYLPVALEFAAEITYPVSEGSSSGLLFASAQLFGIVLTIGMRQLIIQVSILVANISLCCLLVVGTLLTIATREDLKRQRADERKISIATVTSNKIEPGSCTARL